MYTQLPIWSIVAIAFALGISWECFDIIQRYRGVEQKNPIGLAISTFCQVNNRTEQ